MEIKQSDIVEALKACLKVSPLIKPSKTLVNTVYTILDAIYLKNKKYVILEAPTGSGKTIIGFITYFCVNYLNNKINDNELDDNGRCTPLETTAYFLTSAKLLQEQIDKDLDRFNFRDYITMLKGTTNYPCIPATENLTKPFSIDKKGNEIRMISYSDRSCKGMQLSAIRSTYPKCADVCPYKIARNTAAEYSCTILNYAYFLNTRRSDFSKFGNRFLTIADEAHLIPEIVQNTFNTEITQYLTNQLYKFIIEIEQTCEKTQITQEIKEYLMLNFNLFKDKLNTAFQIIGYFKNLYEIKTLITELKKLKGFNEHYVKKLTDLVESIDEALQAEEIVEKLIGERLDDCYYESEIVAKDNSVRVYKHIIRDLAEASMVKRHFLDKTEVCLMMSATLGDVDEYAQLMGIEKDEYIGFRLPSTFNFEKSPIYVVKSGWLNYQNFESNIDKVLNDALFICNNIHPREKGIIHTSTFNICESLKHKINMGISPDKSRFLFYQTADEKEKLIELMKSSNKPYVIIGPSLYEGLDLKDDLGRFNILIKAPYAAMTDYIKKKIERFPFWYKRNTLEKIVQAIGRTNRHENDYSKIYLLDSCFDKLIFETNETIINRIEYKRL